MIPKIIHFIVPEMRSDKQNEIINIAKRLHPDWKIKVWIDREIPERARLKKYLTKANCGAQRADLIRLELIYEYGGVYLDSDMRLHKPLDAVVENLNSLVVCSEDGLNLNNAFFAAPPKHPAVNSIITYLLENEPNWDLPPNKTTGPQLFSIVLRYRDDIYVLPRETFYPYYLNEKRPDKLPPATIAEHEWNGSWLDKNRKKNAKKFMYRKIRKYIKGAVRSFQTSLHSLANFSLTESFKTEHISNSYYNGSDVITITKFNIMMQLPASDMSVVPSLVLKGTFESGEEKFVANIIQGGDWIIDVGANVGLYSLIAASRCGPFGRVYAVEPNERASLYIRKSSFLNWMHDRIKIIDYAISDSKCNIKMEGYSKFMGMSRINHDKIVETSSMNKMSKVDGEKLEIEAKAVSLDELFPVTVPIRLLKLDVEGSEHLVLRGARRLVSEKAFQYIMIEISRETQGDKFHLLMDELKRLCSTGYTPYFVNKKGRLKPASQIDEIVPHLGHNNIVFKGW